MENKVNVAELLKDCPRNMELDCMIYDNLYFDYIREHAIYPIVCYTVDNNGVKHEITFDWCGKYVPADTAKCVIFPKGKTTWEGFHGSFKDGDIVVSLAGNPFILKLYDLLNNNVHSYCGVGCNNGFHLSSSNWTIATGIRHADEEEKRKLLTTIKDNGYKWNAENKTLEKLIEPKFKDGDIIADEHGNIAIYKGTMWYNKNLAEYYCGYRKSDNHFLPEPKRDGHFGLIEELHYATEEEKQKLFDIIRENKYSWNSETKTLEKLIEPKFKVGNVIQNKDSYKVTVTEVNIEDELYFFESVTKGIGGIYFNKQDEWELVPNKFDISTLKPFDSRVLVRDYSYGVWRVSFWGCLINNECGFIYDTTRGCYKQCIPFEGNEHLLGKTDDCDEYFKVWSV